MMQGASRADKLSPGDKSRIKQHLLHGHDNLQLVLEEIERIAIAEGIPELKRFAISQHAKFRRATDEYQKDGDHSEYYVQWRRISDSIFKRIERAEAPPSQQQRDPSIEDDLAESRGPAKPLLIGERIIADYSPYSVAIHRWMQGVRSAPIRKQPEAEGADGGDDDCRHFRLEVPSIILNHGEILGVVGENGSGKTTLLRILARDLCATRHDKLHLDLPTKGGRSEWTRVAYVPQHPPPWNGTLSEYLQLQAAFQGCTSLETNQGYVNRAIDQLELYAQRGKQWRELSGGFQMRAAIAAAIVAMPALLVLDEPLAPLDPHAQQELLRWMERSCWSHELLGLIVSSQHVPEIESVTNKILRIANGRAHFHEPAGGATFFKVSFPARTEEDRARLNRDLEIFEEQGRILEYNYSKGARFAIVKLAGKRTIAEMASMLN